jgi:glutamate-1-semialdehyde 2,1-aminomutase
VSTIPSETALQRYQRRTPGSAELFAAARGVVAGGVSRGTLAFDPYPFYVETAAGARITDVDGNEYIDFVNNYTSLPHGHGHAGTTAAAAAQLAVSSAVGAPMELEAVYAAELRDRIPSLERLRFTTTGSEAVAFAARVARTYTGRTRILKFEGGFHGSHTEFYQDIAVMPPLMPGSSSAARASSAGLEPTQTVTAVYNDPGSVRAAFSAWGPQLAAVVLEPFLGNGALVTATTDFLDAIFEASRDHGTLVIFDEIQSLRAGYRGAQGLWGYRPDLTCVGKIMGGGFSLAAYGGRADLFGPLEGPAPSILQTGTFTANGPALAAGQAAMRELTPEAYDELERRTERVRSGIRESFVRHGIPVHVNGIGSMFNISITDEPVASYRAFRAADASRLAAFRLELLTRGVLIMPRGTGCLSTAVGDDDISQMLETVEQSALAIRS